jgi:GPH family glycoside/pentoside/hexuronide:cation symporter
VTYLIVLVQGCGLISLPFWAWFCKKYEKKPAYYIGGGTGLTFACLISILDKETAWLSYPISIVLGSCLAVCYLVPYSMLPDVIEADELKTGKRREGQYAGFFVVFMKLSITGALAVSNWALGSAGYVSPDSSCGEGSEDAADTQPDGVVTVVRYLIGPIPSLFLAIAILMVSRYPIDRDAHAEMARQAAGARARRASSASLGTVGDHAEALAAHRKNSAAKHETVLGRQNENDEEKSSGAMVAPAP